VAVNILSLLKYLVRTS